MIQKNNKLAIAVVGDFKYLRRYLFSFIKQVRVVGKYKGEILVITSLFTPAILLKIILRDEKIKVFRFKRIKFSKSTNDTLNKINVLGKPNRNKTKKFQWHKFHLFDEKLKIWDQIFYIDINMKIHFDINPILELNPTNKLFARADSYPRYDHDLSSQFFKESIYYEKLNKNYDLSKKDYFQTGIMFYDTKIIKKDTKDNLIKLVEKFPLSTTNEQGIMNLHFGFDIKNYQELDVNVGEYVTYYYWMKKGEKIIITKQSREQYK
jgi:hypothetical protein